eukprot:CAMPEP_0119108618 /NCGR_PEP_ID=MMETSP1180-20130426/15479_1 /TAXON_ID=3052 ORGANISM="Chlamydomonas cf sp, Strain CCMP681" /NCGR_SAMPLE_ID=MMETSP1180 /ASSEMBLY_ACC=CAM_ASM_000741 /LENGTH=47 /DNA_ID= /DNA_START= /DNA_END= /DNA_ORIENTATION=
MTQSVNDFGNDSVLVHMYLPLPATGLLEQSNPSMSTCTTEQLNLSAA